MLLAWAAAAVAGLAAVAVALARRFAPDLPSRSVVLPVVALAPLCFPFAIGLLFGNLDVFFPLLYGAMLLAVRRARRRPPGRRRRRTRDRRRSPSSTRARSASGSASGASAANGRAAGSSSSRSGSAWPSCASLLIGGVSFWTDYVAVVRAGSSADLVDPRNAGPAAQLAILLGAGDGFARTAQIL